MYEIKSKSNSSTCMKVEGGYQESENNDFEMTKRKHKQGMNFPCPELACILTFSTEEEMTVHIDSGNHSSVDMDRDDLTADDKVKMSWIQGLSGSIEAGKTGK